MNNSTVSSIELKPIRGDLRVLNLSIIMMIVFAALNLAAVFRLVGVPGLPEILLLIYRAMDVAIVAAFFYYCRLNIRLRTLDLLLFVFSIYPFFIGLALGNLSITFINDSLIFILFTLKIIIFRTILARIEQVIELDTVFKLPSRKIVFWSTSIAVVSLCIAFIFLAQGKSFYYQAPAELTFAAALVLAQGKIFAYLALLMLALLAGKRMVIIGLLVMAGLAAIASPKIRVALFRLFLASVITSAAIIISNTSLANMDFVSLDKLLGTFRQLEKADELADNFLEILMYLDPLRYAEFVSLQPHLTGWAYWFGNGYGFRYDLDFAFLQEFGYEEGANITNAHFTPLAIMAKFGVLGLGIWLVVLIIALSARIDRRSYVQYACRLALVAMVVQSVFAFGFFINFFTPFYIAIVTVGARKLFKGHRILFNFKLSKGYT